jgi:hypothetical protein
MGWATGALLASAIEGGLGIATGVLGIGLIPEQLANLPSQALEANQSIREGLATGNNYKTLVGVGQAMGVVGAVAGTIVGAKAGVSNLGNTRLGKFSVGLHKDIKGKVPGLDSHHVGQKAVMRELVEGYDPESAPAILVPQVGHTRSGPAGILSRDTTGIRSVRQLIARDVRELRRVYPDVPNAALRQLIEMNREMYPQAMTKASR